MDAGRDRVLPPALVAALALVTVTIAGCGQKGPLTLTDPQTEIIDATTGEEEQTEDQESSGDNSEE